MLPAKLSVRRHNLRVSSYSRPHNIRGVTFIELLVTLVILSILAATALPYAEITVRRSKEIELRQALRDIRGAIDRFHLDWETAKISKLDNAVSEDGYPKTLKILVEGVGSVQAKGGKIKYLRRIPRDPFAAQGQPMYDQWVPRGYQDDLDSNAWGGKDVYDVHSASTRKAIDGTLYKDW
ncbi:MAG: type II secretion system protein [Gammaproteobacteria bacterium]|jgi:general secretion pathway protein G|nr:type II secretion system protein [Gammaproteobacteria bacterium]